MRKRKRRTEEGRDDDEDLEEVAEGEVVGLVEVEVAGQPRESHGIALNILHDKRNKMKK